MRIICCFLLVTFLRNIQSEEMSHNWYIGKNTIYYPFGQISRIFDDIRYGNSYFTDQHNNKIKSIINSLGLEIGISNVT